MLNPGAVRDRMVSNIDKESLRKQIETTINIIRTFKKKDPEKGAFIDARLLPFEPVVGLVITDGDLPEGEIKVELMLKNTAPDEWPNVIITRKESERYNQFMKHFIELLNLSDPI